MSAPVVRFAPSPTGYLHIGGGRTALFNWLFAKHTGGDFLLRIEDTDRARSTPEAVDAILQGMKWLGLDWQGEPVMQFARMNRHAEVAHELLKKGQAYYCYATPEELDAMREEQIAKGLPQRYDGRWRNRDPKDAPAGIKPVIRIKAPSDRNGDMVINDLVQGEVKIPYTQLDDMILLRSDGTPTYMLSVVVDDHDMGITHVIRGDDHLTNAFRQRMIYDAMGWNVPAFAHIPMILGPDGAKLSKRHGAVGLHVYEEMGYLPEAMRNYLLRLGWGHGDTEIVSTEDAIKIFSVEGIGKSPSRMDFAKLAHVNNHYMREAAAKDPARLVSLLKPFLEKATGIALSEQARTWITACLPALTERTTTLIELAEAAAFFARPRPLPLNDDAQKQLDDNGRATVKAAAETIAAVENFTAADIEAAVKSFAQAKDLKMGKVGMPLRAALTGTTNSPSIFMLMEIMGRAETLARLGDVAA